MGFYDGVMLKLPKITYFRIYINTREIDYVFRMHFAFVEFGILTIGIERIISYCRKLMWDNNQKRYLSS